MLIQKIQVFQTKIVSFNYRKAHNLFFHEKSYRKLLIEQQYVALGRFKKPAFDL